jgi:hypothetical protein
MFLGMAKNSQVRRASCPFGFALPKIPTSGKIGQKWGTRGSFIYVPEARQFLGLRAQDALATAGSMPALPGAFESCRLEDFTGHLYVIEGMRSVARDLDFLVALPR